jgi:hypothetical protein
MKKLIVQPQSRRECDYKFLLRGQKYINCHDELFCFPASHRKTKLTESLQTLRLSGENIFQAPLPDGLEEKGR